MLYFFFFNDTATTEIYTLSLHDALPISQRRSSGRSCCRRWSRPDRLAAIGRDRKSTRLNSSHSQISYAVFCLKKKKKRPRRPGRSGQLQQNPGPVPVASCDGQLLLRERD